MVARCWGCKRVPPTCQHSEQDAGDHQGPPRRSSPPSPLREGYFPRKDGDPNMFAVSRYTVGRVFRCVLLSFHALDVIQACFLAA